MNRKLFYTCYKILTLPSWYRKQYILPWQCSHIERQVVLSVSVYCLQTAVLKTDLKCESTVRIYWRLKIDWSIPYKSIIILVEWTLWLGIAAEMSYNKDNEFRSFPETNSSDFYGHFVSSIRRHSLPKIANITLSKFRQ